MELDNSLNLGSLFLLVDSCWSASKNKKRKDLDCLSIWVKKQFRLIVRHTEGKNKMQIGWYWGLA